MKKKVELLTQLTGGEALSGERAAKLFGISRQALHKRIQSLRKEGFDIVGKPKSGYRLLAGSRALCPELLIPALKTRALGRNYHYFAHISSTQDRAKELAQQGEPSGAVVLAETQSAGRGRLSRSWSSLAGGLWTSIILRPPVAPQKVTSLTFVLCLAVRDTLAAFCGLEFKIKWPNDILVLAGPDWKKVCGILLEMSAESERVHWVAAGLGLNVNNAVPRSLKAKAMGLAELVGKPLDRTALIVALFKNIEDYYERYCELGFDHFKKQYESHLIYKNKTILISNPPEKIKAKFLGIDADGALLAIDDQNRIQRIYSGEISLF